MLGLCVFLKKDLFIFIYMSTLQLSSDTHQKRASDPVTDGCEPPCGCWELNSGPLEEQSVLLTAEPSLQPHQAFCKGSILPLSCNSSFLISGISQPSSHSKSVAKWKQKWEGKVLQIQVVVQSNQGVTEAKWSNCCTVQDQKQSPPPLCC